MSVHRIRLRGPWKYEWFAARSDPPSLDSPATDPSAVLVGVATMPARWDALFGRRAGRVRFRRVFHRPTNLDPDERVYVVVERLIAGATLELDGHRLGRIAPDEERGEFDITSLVRPNSELSIELAHDPRADDARAGEVWGTVAVEIRGSGR
ncbi:MAG: hypothetical protein WD066_03730 [Planctomycetaceae bacterium]